MIYKKLGNTDIEISHVCLGTMTWGCQNTQSDAHEQMDYALDQGINFFDTAELYAIPPEEHTQGLTETYIGTWFQEKGKRDKIILASKACGKTFPYIHNGAELGREKLEMAIEDSLKRLQTDYIDLYQLHWPQYPYPHHGNHGAGALDYMDVDTNKETDRFLEILETLTQFIKDGKIRSFGLSNDTPWGVMKYLELARKHGYAEVASVQNEYSLLYRHDEPYLSEVCTRENVTYLPYSALAAGSISGKYLNGARPEGARWSLGKDNRRNQRDTDISQQAITEYINLAKKHNLDVCEMALAFCYQQQWIGSTIIGATTMDQLKSNIRAKDISLSDDLLTDIHNIYRQHPMPY